MSEFSGFFDAHKVSGDWDRTYVAAEFARYFASFVGNGVFAGQSNELQVIQSNPQGMAVTVASGKAWIDGYMYYNDADLVLPIDNADGALNRIDTIVCRWSSVDRMIKAYVKKGIAAANPTVPAIQWDADIKELQLASIRINAGIVSIIQSSITDTRPNNNVCGWVTGVISQVDTATLFLQWQAAYDNEYKNTQEYIAQQKALWEEFFDNISSDMGIIDGSVTTQKLANEAVTTPKIGVAAVTEAKIADGAVTASKLAAESVAKSYNFNILTSGWSSSGIYEIALAGLSRDKDLALVFANSNTLANVEAWNEAQLKIYQTTDGKITLKSESVPTTTLQVVVVVYKNVHA